MTASQLLIASMHAALVSERVYSIGIWDASLHRGAKIYISRLQQALFISFELQHRG